MRYAIRDVMKVTVLDITTNKPVLYLSSLKTSGLEAMGSTVYARGGSGNAKLVGFDSDREAKLTIEDALVSPDSLGLLLGATPVTGAQTITNTEILTVDASNKITLSQTPLGTNGTNKTFYATTDGSTLGNEITYAATPATGKYQITGNQVTFYTDMPQGSLIIATYQYNSASSTKKIAVDSTKFPGAYKFVGECFVKNENNIDVPATFIINKGKIVSNFSFNMGASGDPAVIKFDVDCLKPIGSNELVTIIIEE